MSQKKVTYHGPRERGVYKVQMGCSRVLGLAVSSSAERLFQGPWPRAAFIVSLTTRNLACRLVGRKRTVLAAAGGGANVCVRVFWLSPFFQA